MRSQVHLTTQERAKIEQLLSSELVPSLGRAAGWILLLVDSGPSGPHFSDEDAARKLSVSTERVVSARERYAEFGIEYVLFSRRPGRRKLNPAQQQYLVRLAQSEPPIGSARWTYGLLAKELVNLGYVESITGETVRRLLGEVEFKRPSVYRRSE